MQSTTLRTGELAKQAGVGIETVRYYERRGLLPRPQRTASGYRSYTQKDVDRLRFIRTAAASGYTLDEIEQLLELRAATRPDRRAARQITRERIDDIDQRIAALGEMRAALSRLLHACEHDRRVGGWAILEMNAGTAEQAR